MPRIPTIKNLEDLVTEYNGNFSVRTPPYAYCRLSAANRHLAASKTDCEGGRVEAGGGLHHQDVTDQVEGGLGRETEQKRFVMQMATVVLGSLEPGYPFCNHNGCRIVRAPLASSMSLLLPASN